jgi:hypothetical protein
MERGWRSEASGFGCNLVLQSRFRRKCFAEITGCHPGAECMPLKKIIQEPLQAAADEVYFRSLGQQWQVGLAFRKRIRDFP